MQGHIGKILGVVFGAMVGKIPGAIVGFIIGWYFDTGLKKDFSGNGSFASFFSDKNELTSSAIFFHSLFGCLGHIAKADGTVTKGEIAIANRLMDDMQLTGAVRKEAQDAFREGKDPHFPLEDQLQDLIKDVQNRKDVLNVFLEILIEATFADGELSINEMQLLTKIAGILGFTDKELHTRIKQFEAEMRFRQRKEAFAQARQEAKQRAQAQAEAFRQQAYERARQSHSDGGGQSQSHNRYYNPRYDDKQRLADAYQILDVAPNADERTLKKAYKRAMTAHHPDKLASKGLPPAALEKAKAKAQDIQAAYELIKKERSLTT
jgi:DnaJ like chaperone protein